MRAKGRAASAFRKPGLATAVLALGLSLIGLTPPDVTAATPTVVLTLSVKPAWIEFGGTFTLTATVTPKQPVTGLLRVGIFAENGLPAYGELHDCTPGCLEVNAGIATWEWDGLTSKRTITVLWTDSGGGSTRNRFNVGISGGDANYAPLDWVVGYIGGPPPTPTPKPTRRPTPISTIKPAATPHPTLAAAPTSGAATSAVSTPTAWPSSPPSTIPLTTDAPALASSSPGAPPAKDVAATSFPPTILILALIVAVMVVGGLFALRWLRRAERSHEHRRK